MATTTPSELPDFIIACCQQDPNPAQLYCIKSNAARLTTASDNSINTIPMPQLSQYAGRQGVLALVCNAIRTHAAQECSADVRAALQEIRKSLAVSNMRKLAVLVKITRALQQVNITVAGFKGITTAQLAYGDITLRACGDLDILVHEENVEQARDILKSLGYKPGYSFSDFQRQKLKKVIHAESFYTEDRSIMIELHWSLSSSEFWAPIENLNYLEDCASVSIKQLTLPTFNLEKLFVYLCFHGQRHSWSALFWLVDISRLIEANSEDEIFWQRIVELAKNGEVETIVLSSFILCRDVLGTPLPNSIENSLLGRASLLCTAAAIKQELLEQLSDTSREGPPRHRAFSINQMRLLEGFAKKIKYVASIAQVQEADYAILDLPPWLHFLYYILRPLNIATRKLKPQG